MLLNVLITIYACLMILDFLFMAFLHLFHDRKGYYKTGMFIWLGMLLGFFLDGVIADKLGHVNHIFGIAFLNITTHSLAKLGADLYKLNIPHGKLITFSLITWISGILLHYLFGASFTWTSLVVCVGIVAPVLLVGQKILQSSGKLTIIDRLFGLLLFAEGLHILDYPFLRQVDNAAVFGFSLALMIVYFASMLIPVVINRRISADFTELLEKEVAAKTGKLEESVVSLNNAHAKLVYSSRLASLGEMAGGIAHEINNPLGTIGLRASQIRRLLEKDQVGNQNVYKFLDVIEETVKRIERIINGLRVFSRSSTNERYELVPVTKIIEETLDLCEEHFKNHNIPLIVKNNFADGEIECQRVQISQVLLNLLNNAKHAVQMHESDRWVRLDVEDFGLWITISITDSGPGIPPDIQDRILEPFYTTKPVGQGTGLGLSISNGITEQHGGQLYLDKQSRLTRFVVKLPKTQSQVGINSMRKRSA